MTLASEDVTDRWSNGAEARRPTGWFCSFVRSFTASPHASFVANAPTIRSTLVTAFYIRLIKQRGVTWQNRAQFFGIAATNMRRILVERARARNASKRGSGDYKLDLTDVSDVPLGTNRLDLLALDKALEELAAFDPQQCRIVEAKFFGGLSIEETAEVIGISPATVKREWALAKAWLFRELS